MSKTDQDKAAGAHYDFPNGVQVLDITRHLCFRTGSIVKYLCRLGKKDGESRLSDLLKCQKYLDDLIASEIDDRARREALSGSVTSNPDYVANHTGNVPSGCETGSEVPLKACEDLGRPAHDCSLCDLKKVCVLSEYDLDSDDIAEYHTSVPEAITRAGIRRKIL
jgi:hypothetical protein